MCVCKKSILVAEQPLSFFSLYFEYVRLRIHYVSKRLKKSLVEYSPLFRSGLLNLLSLSFLCVFFRLSLCLYLSYRLGISFGFYRKVPSSSCPCLFIHVPLSFSLFRLCLFSCSLFVVCFLLEYVHGARV